MTLVVIQYAVASNPTLVISSNTPTTVLLTVQCDTNTAPTLQISTNQVSWWSSSTVTNTELIVADKDDQYGSPKYFRLIP